MILADKIVRLRKKNGWSQEDLAEQMHVSRQAVSKWEAAQSTPDLDKILLMGRLFGVTTDYLLKDEMEDEEFTDSVLDTPVKKVTLSQANEYLKHRKDASRKIAFATFLCILSPVPLLLLLALHENNPALLSANLAVGGGIVILLLAVAAAVALFVRVGLKNEPYEFMDKEPFETEYGVSGLVKQKQKDYRSAYARFNIFGACTCILSPVPVVCAALTEQAVLVLTSVCATLLIVAIGVAFFIVAGVRWASMQRLLQEGEYAPKSSKSKVIQTVDSVYWLAVTAIYLLWSFLSGDWHITWVVWPVAGIASSAIQPICDLVIKKEQ